MRFRVRHVMTPHPECVRIVERAGRLFDLLSSSTHHGFPVIVRDAKTGPTFFQGIILKKQLAVILKARDWSTEKPVPFRRTPDDDDEVSTSSCLSYHDLERSYPRYPTASKDFVVDNVDRQAWVDLSPYVNATPFVLQEEAPFVRAYRLFRSCGLRHVVVLDHWNRVKGILTRRDLLEEHCERRFRMAKRGEPELGLYPASRKLGPLQPRARHRQLSEAHSRRTERASQVHKMLLTVPLLDFTVTEDNDKIGEDVERGGIK